MFSLVFILGCVGATNIDATNIDVTNIDVTDATGITDVTTLQQNVYDTPKITCKSYNWNRMTCSWNVSESNNNLSLLTRLQWNRNTWDCIEDEGNSCPTIRGLCWWNDCVGYQSGSNVCYWGSNDETIEYLDTYRYILRLVNTNGIIVDCIVVDPLVITKLDPVKNLHSINLASNATASNATVKIRWRSPVQIYYSLDYDELQVPSLNTNILYSIELLSNGNIIATYNTTGAKTNLLFTDLQVDREYVAKVKCISLVRTTSRSSFIEKGFWSDSVNITFIA